MATTGIVIFLFLVPARITAVTAAVVNKEGKDNKKWEDESDGWNTGQNQESLCAEKGIKEWKREMLVLTVDNRQLTASKDFRFIQTV